MFYELIGIWWLTSEVTSNSGVTSKIFVSEVTVCRLKISCFWVCHKIAIMQQDHSWLDSFVVHTNLQPVKLFCAFYFFQFSTLCLFCATRVTSNCSSSSEKLPDRLVELLTLVLAMLTTKWSFILINPTCLIHLLIQEIAFS